MLNGCAVHLSDGCLAAMQVPWERKYLAGWGYLLSRDVVQHVVNATSAWDRAPGHAPGWYAGLHWEDVMIGLIASEFTGEEPQVRCMHLLNSTSFLGAHLHAWCIEP